MAERPAPDRQTGVRIPLAPCFCRYIFKSGFADFNMSNQAAKHKHNGKSKHNKLNELQDILLSLTEEERAVLPLLSSCNLEQLIEKTKLNKEAVLRALMFLSNKGLIKLHVSETKKVVLGKNGLVYREKGLPERQLLNALYKSSDKSITFEEAKSFLTQQELTAAIGVLKKYGIIEIDKNVIKLVKQASKKLLEEKFLEQLPLDINALTDEQKYCYEQLVKRPGIIEVEKQSIYNYELTEKGKAILPLLEKEKVKLIERLTPEMLKSKSWRGQKFRYYDITSSVPSIQGGKPHYYLHFLAEVETMLKQLGFKKMYGPLIVNEFWNFDALFQPQFHSAREWSDTYSVNVASKLEMPKQLVKAVKQTHEQSWKYTWSEEKAKQAILRPQTTVVSAYTLYKLREKLKTIKVKSSDPVVIAKYYALARCFRPDVVDSTHLSEFNQLEGIIIGINLNFNHLLGVLKQLTLSITKAKHIRFLPDYYPFTEPSVEIDVKFQQNWLEIGGAGIFREEVVKPLLGSSYDENITVLAWGLGIDRLAMIKYGLNDIRLLFSNQLEFLRKQTLK